MVNATGDDRRIPHEVNTCRNNNNVCVLTVRCVVVKCKKFLTRRTKTVKRDNLERKGRGRRIRAMVKTYFGFFSHPLALSTNYFQNRKQICILMYTGVHSVYSVLPLVQRTRGFMFVFHIFKPGIIILIPFVHHR